MAAVLTFARTCYVNPASIISRCIPHAEKLDAFGSISRSLQSEGTRGMLIFRTSRLVLPWTTCCRTGNVSNFVNCNQRVIHICSTVRNAYNTKTRLGFLLTNDNVTYRKALRRSLTFATTEHLSLKRCATSFIFRGLSSSAPFYNKQHKVISKTRDAVKEHLSSFNENVFTVPNLLCVSRIAMTPFISYFVLTEQYITSLSLFTLAGLTDLLDGYIARNFKNQQSMIGSFLDPMADKFLVATLFVSLTAVHLIPVPLAALIIARDVGLLTAGFVVRYKSLPHPKSLRKYFDLTYATAKLSPTAISKVNTAVQLFLVAATLGAPIFYYVDHDYLQALWYLTASTTVMSGFSYIFSKHTYKIFKSSSKS